MEDISLRGPEGLQMLSPYSHDLFLGLGQLSGLASHRLDFSFLPSRREPLDQPPELALVVLVGVLYLLHQLFPVFLLFLGDQPFTPVPHAPEFSPGLLCPGLQEYTVRCAPLGHRRLDLVVVPAPTKLAARDFGADRLLGCLLGPLYKVSYPCTRTVGDSAIKGTLTVFEASRFEAGESLR